jgi:hypothetical protein
VEQRVEVEVAGVVRVEAVAGVCWLDGLPAVAGEKLPGRRRRVRLLCRLHDVAVFGGPNAVAAVRAERTGKAVTRLDGVGGARPHGRFAWLAEQSHDGRTGWVIASHPVLREQTAGGVVLVDDEAVVPRLDAVVEYVVDAWTSRLVLDDPAWAWEDDWGRWSVWDLDTAVMPDGGGLPEVGQVPPVLLGQLLRYAYRVVPAAVVVYEPRELVGIAHARELGV